MTFSRLFQSTTLLLILLGSGLAAARAEAVTYQFTTLAEYPFGVGSIDIDGDNVAWGSYGIGPGYSGSPRTNIFDGRGTFLPADNTTYYDNGTRPRVSGDNFVWSEYLSSGNPHQVFLLDNATDTQTALGAGFNPDVSGGNVAWITGNGTAREVQFYDGSTTTQITSNTIKDDGVRISGNNLVWSGHDGNDWDLYFYDGSTTSQLTNSNYNETSPQIDGNNVVWSGYDGNDWEIFHFDGTTTTQLTNNNFNDDSPQIMGSNIVWEGYDGNDDEIFLYDGTTTTQLTNNSFHDRAPQVSGNSVAWQGFDGNDDEIFLFDGTTTTQLTDNNVDDDSPQLSGDTVAFRQVRQNGQTLLDSNLIVAAPLDTPSNASFSRTADVNELTIDFGPVPLYGTVAPVSFELANYLPQGATLASVAHMDLLGSTSSGDTEVLSADLQLFTDLPGNLFQPQSEAIFNPILPGISESTYELEFTDTLGNDQTLLLTLKGVALVTDDPSIPNLVYDAATGEVVLDPDASPGIIGYRLLNDDNAFLSSGHTPILAGVATSEDFEISEAAFSSGSGSIGLILPTGLNRRQLAEMLDINEAITGFQQPTVPFDLIVIPGPVPEPSTYLLGLFALAGLGAFRLRRRS